MSQKKRILFIASHRKNRAPGQRFRYEQYLDFLEENGFEIELTKLISKEDDKYLYKRGHYLKKILFTIKSYLIRYKNLKRINDYDIIFVFREALMTGSTYFENKFKNSRAKVVFDFDDSIWLQNVSDANKWFAWMKNPKKTEQIIALSDMVFAGNQYLANYAKKNNDCVKIIPTTIDTEEYKKQQLEQTDKICIGWSGSITTIQHFKLAIPFLLKIKEKYKDKVSFKVIGDSNYFNDELEIQGIAWSKEDEIKELSSIDIGIMPLPDDEWAKGKCGLKGLQYMALGTPTIMSPVGVNDDIITDGENGFLASSDEEWIEKLSQLIESEDLRSSIGAMARDTVLKRYSVDANKQLYVDYFNELLSK